MEVLFGWSVPKHYPTAHKILPKHTPHKFFLRDTVLIRTRVVWTVKNNVSSNPHCANRTNSRGSHWDLCFVRRSILRYVSPKQNQMTAELLAFEFFF